MNRKQILAGIVAILFASSPSISLGDFLMIDDFDSGSGEVLIGPEQTGSVELDIFGIDPSRTIGGERQIFADGEADLEDSQLNVRLFDPGNGNPFFNDIFHFNATGTTGYRWGHNSDLDLALDQLDLSVASLVSSIDVDFDFEATVYLTLTSARGDATETTETITKATIDSDQTNLTFSWQAAEFSNVDLTDVDLIELGFDGYDFVGELESFSVNAVVPEPSATMFLISCPLLTPRRRRE